MTNTDYVQYSGSHATTRSKSILIEKNGFEKSTGHRGSGVYFWESNAYARGLAIAWYVTSMRRGSYSKDKDKTCVVIWADLTASIDEIVDYTSPEWRKYFLELSKNLEFADDKEEAFKIYDYVVERIEELLGNTIKLTIAMVNPPNKPRYYPTQIYGMACCYIVRDVKCIDIKEREIIENFNILKDEECLNVLK
ncbi:MAG: hypothetical protein HQK65_03520 [Desulfamplus sp.]|nr:hypothetical protein [Desulfamplus sp.]